MTKHSLPPDILYAGVPRSGSTWIWQNLEQHPDIWTLPYKSTQYTSGKAKDRRKKTRQYLKDGRFKVAQRAPSSWDWHYFKHPFVNERWYNKLFEPAQGKMTVEIDPACFRLPLDRIQSIRTWRPDMKVLIALRNPIDRIWSHAKHKFLRAELRQMDQVEATEWLAFFALKNQVKNNRYAHNLQHWQAVFPKDQMFVYFYEDIVQRPEALLQEMCTFLGLSFDASYFQSAIDVQGNYTGHREIPPAFHRHLAQQFIGEIEQVNAMLGSYTNDWLEQARTILQQNPA